MKKRCRGIGDGPPGESEDEDIAAVVEDEDEDDEEDDEEDNDEDDSSQLSARQCNFFIVSINH